MYILLIVVLLISYKLLLVKIFLKLGLILFKIKIIVSKKWIKIIKYNSTIY